MLKSCQSVGKSGEETNLTVTEREQVLQPSTTWIQKQKINRHVSRKD